MIHEKKDILTKEYVFSYITHLDVFEHYLGKLSIPCTIHSPLHKDNHPSFGLFVSLRNKDVIFKDFTLNVMGDSIRYVQLKYNLSYDEALMKVAADLNIKKYAIQTKEQDHLKKSTIRETNIKLTADIGVFTVNDKKYWSQYGISKETLVKHDVYKADVLRINNNVFVYRNDSPIYIYKYIYNYKVYLKSYMPYNHKYKFRNNFQNVSQQLLHGIKLLPDSGDKLIITKSAKDSMVLDELGFYNIAVQSEPLGISTHHMMWLKERWKNIYVLFDNDYDKQQNWGQLFASKLCSEHKLHNIFIPKMYLAKDTSDLVKKYNKKTATKLINSLL